MTLCMHGACVSLTAFELPFGPPEGFVNGNAYRWRSHGLSYVPITYTTSFACVQHHTIGSRGDKERTGVRVKIRHAVHFLQNSKSRDEMDRKTFVEGLPKGGKKGIRVIPTQQTTGTSIRLAVKIIMAGAK